MSASRRSGLASASCRSSSTKAAPSSTGRVVQPGCSQTSTSTWTPSNNRVARTVRSQAAPAAGRRPIPGRRPRPRPGCRARVSAPRRSAATPGRRGSAHLGAPPRTARATAWPRTQLIRSRGGGRSQTQVARGAAIGSAQPLDDRHVGLSAALAHRLQAVAAAGALELVEQRGHERAPVAPIGWPRAMRAAVDVDLVGVGAGLLQPRPARRTRTPR